MKGKRIWTTYRLPFSAVAINCEEHTDKGVMRASFLVTPESRRRIDYNPWLHVLHLSRMMDALQAEGEPWQA